MCKILILQTLYNIFDEQLEFQIKDRLSFQRFLGLSLSDKVPGAKTIWLWRERFKKHKLMDKIFRKFDQELKDKGYLVMSGQIIDASIVPAPRQQNTRAEKDCIKEGKTPEDWKENSHKLAQKDFNARWVMKYKKAKMRGGVITRISDHITSYNIFEKFISNRDIVDIASRQQAFYKMSLCRHCIMWISSDEV